MTKASIALSELAEKGADVDFVCEMLQFAAQRLMEIDVEALCGAPYGDRSGPRQNARNGYRKRLRETRSGAVDLRIPKTRKGSYFAQETADAAHAQWRIVADQLREKFPKLSVMDGRRRKRRAGLHGLSQGAP
jgi:hypothetical protein